MKTVVIFDIETQAKIDDMHGIDRVSKVKMLEVSCLSYLVVDADEVLAGPDRAAAAVDAAQMHTLWRDDETDPDGPFEQMLKAFDDAEVIASYNGLGFDHLVMIKYYQRNTRRYQGHVCKAHDVFARLRDATELWYKLDALLKENQIPTKTANGLLAIEWWANGEREKLQEYCEQVRCFFRRRTPLNRTNTCAAVSFRTCARLRGCWCCRNSNCPRRSSWPQILCLAWRVPFRQHESQRRLMNMKLLKRHENALKVSFGTA